MRGSVPVQRLVQTAKDYGYDAVALADVNSMYGVVDFSNAAKKANIKPIIGVEVLSDTQRAVLLAEDRTGYKNLCRITTAVNLDANFDLIRRLKNNCKGLICICTQPGLLKELRKVFSKDYLFAGCQGASEADFAKANKVRPVACTNFNIT
ncbi:MAG: PHP domain-containing protein, partial [Planctomycetota bacterium]